MGVAVAADVGVALGACAVSVAKMLKAMAVSVALSSGVGCGTQDTSAKKMAKKMQKDAFIIIPLLARRRYLQLTLKGLLLNDFAHFSVGHPTLVGPCSPFWAQGGPRQVTVSRAGKSDPKF